MPLIEPVATCRKFNHLKRHAQWFYLQLKTKLDPLGRIDGHPGIINSTLFPLRKDVRDTDISHWLLECEQVGLLRCYHDAHGRAVVQVYDAVQRLSPKNMKSMFDPPEARQPEMFSENAAVNKKGNEVKENGTRARKKTDARPTCADTPPDWEKPKNPNTGELRSANPDPRVPNYAPPVAKLRREMWQLLADEKQLTDRIKAEKEKQQPDRDLLAALISNRANLRTEMKTVGT